MKKLKRDLLKRLEHDGWLVTRRADGLEWWAHEIWALQSRWSPAGLTLYLTFLTDPLPDSPTGFCEIATSRRVPENRDEPAEPVLVVTPNWLDELPRFVADLNAIRGGELKSPVSGDEGN